MTSFIILGLAEAAKDNGARATPKTAPASIAPAERNRSIWLRWGSQIGIAVLVGSRCAYIIRSPYAAISY